MFRQAFERNAVFHYTLAARFNLAVAKGDQAEMEQAASVARKNPASADLLNVTEGFVLAYSGRLREARKKWQVAADLARKRGAHERAATIEVAEALWEAFYGNSTEATKGATEALSAVLDDPVLRERFGAAASERVRSGFEIHQVVRQYLALYEELLIYREATVRVEGSTPARP